MKKGLNLFIILLIIEISLVSAVPRIEPYVNDFANLLTPEEETQLNIQADAIEQNTTYEIAIVTVQNTGGQDRIEYANELGDENGVGKKDMDNGVVVLWSVEDGGAIATGRFSESILNDAKVIRIGKEARPLFDEGSYYQAFSLVLTNINNEIVAHQEGITNSSDTEESSSGNLDMSDLALIIIFGAVLGIIIWVIFAKSSGGNDYDFSTGAATGAIAGSVLGKGRTSSGSGGGGVFRGSGSFGGGSFGGGGGKF